MTTSGTPAKRSTPASTVGHGRTVKPIGGQGSGFPNWENRTLYRGDNLEFMRSMNSKSVHLIATDPPFNKGRDFHATPESLAAGASFEDRWRWDEDVHPEWVEQIQDDWPSVWAVIDWTRIVHSDAMAAFLCFMGVRLVAMHRILREDGSIYLHCDTTAGAYLKTLMDAVFGPECFRNEVEWCYTGNSEPKAHFPKKHDRILFYARSTTTKFNIVRLPYKEATLRRYNHVDSEGRRYKMSSLRSGLERVYMKEGRAALDWWDDIPTVRGKASTGYPTQKPLALYQRIIRASSNPGDIVFDPFAGCATTPIAAEIEGRQWVACDEWAGAYDVVTERLEALKVGSGGQEEMAYYPVAQREEPLVRTDTGETAAPPLKSLRRKSSPPTMKRAEMLEALITRDGMQCQGCGREFDHARYFELDHKLPRSEGGSNELENRVLLCGPCNRTKSNTLTLTGLRKQNRADGFLVAPLK